MKIIWTPANDFQTQLNLQWSQRMQLQLDNVTCFAKLNKVPLVVPSVTTENVSHSCRSSRIDPTFRRLFPWLTVVLRPFQHYRGSNRTGSTGRPLSTDSAVSEKPPMRWSESEWRTGSRVQRHLYCETLKVWWIFCERFLWWIICLQTWFLSSGISAEPVLPWILIR